MRILKSTRTASFSALLALYIVSNIDLIKRAVAGVRQTGKIPPELVSALILCILLTAIIGYLFAAKINSKSHRYGLGIFFMCMNLALIYLQMPSAGYLHYFLIAVFLMNATLVTPIAATILTLTAGLAMEVFYYFNGDTVLFRTFIPIVLCSGAITYLFGLAFAEWRSQIAMFEEAKDSAERLALANLNLQKNIVHAEMWARGKERIRIAREIHDTTGYTLTAILMQIHAAKEILDKKKEDIKPRLIKIEGMVRDAIYDIRNEVAGLRDEIEAIEGWREHCRDICETFADSTGVQISFEFDEPFNYVDDEIGKTVSSLIQESLTNAYRHGSATRIDVVLGFENERILLRISDNGKGAEHLQIGNGLSGMRERVEGLGGDIAWRTSRNKGFDIGIEIPLKMQSDAEAI